jgi:hypothetical protein
MTEKEKLKIEYSVFQKVILDFQLKSHEKYLKRFVFVFKQTDGDQNGIVDEVGLFSNLTCNSPSR